MTRSPARRTGIRAKVTAALLIVALVPLAVTGVLVYREARAAAKEDAIERLAGIAAVQEARVDAYALSSLENMALVASRTQLRLTLSAQLEAPNDEQLALMQRILNDAQSSSSTARRIELVDLDGIVQASSDGEQLGVDRSSEPSFVLGLDGPDLSHVSERDGERRVIQARPMSLDDKQLGVVMIEASLSPLEALMSDYTGLGDSGETILASGLDADQVALLGPIRFPEQLDGDDSAIRADLLARALGGVEGEVTDQVDYRGREVLAVARSIDTVPGWALVVKVDRQEALASADRLRDLLLVAFTLAAIAVVGAAWLLARSITRPVLELHQTAVAVAAGDTERRVSARSNDELADLALQFNRMTDELTEANARLQLTNEQLEEFVYISSHDLKSPLRSISSFSQLLQAEYETQFDEQGRTYLGFIRDGTTRMHVVIDDLLEYLRIEKTGHVADDVDLGVVIDDVLDLHRPLLDDCDADIRLADLPTITGSAALLRQLFDNVVQNAIRYRRPNQQLILEIAATREGDCWQIVLADNGVGVPQDRRQDAFTVFKRLSETGDGSGMGLAICRRIARRHGGDAGMADSPHGGVSVIVTLAADGPSASSSAGVTASARAETNGSGSA